MIFRQVILGDLDEALDEPANHLHYVVRPGAFEGAPMCMVGARAYRRSMFARVSCSWSSLPLYWLGPSHRPLPRWAMR